VDGNKVWIDCCTEFAIMMVNTFLLVTDVINEQG
jgi:hypothetical protein